MKLDRLIAMAPALHLTGNRLVLRRLQEGDVATAIAHEEDRRIMRWIRDPQPREQIESRTREMLAHWAGVEGKWLVLAAADRNDDAMFGIVCMRVVTAESQIFEIGYRLHPDVHRRGLATEACELMFDFLFERIEARKLIALCAADNEPSWRLMEKLGMRREALLREHFFLEGRWQDEIICGLLRREWRQG
ncbi:MAG: GNAT family N-acetyltransferase [Planctomycetes bacterium]|nr:GNAT family N-acetyltransferase [Planctomycetota bacterium]